MKIKEVSLIFSEANIIEERLFQMTR